MLPEIQQVFADLRRDLETQLEAHAAQTLDGEVEEGKDSGELIAYLEFDDAGVYQRAESAYGAGVTLHCVASFLPPKDVTYDVEVESSTGGGGQWESVSCGEKLKFDIKTSLWRKTKLRVKVTTNPGAGKRRVQLTYRY